MHSRVLKIDKSKLLRALDLSKSGEKMRGNVLGLLLEYIVKEKETSEIKERTCTKSCAQY